MTSPSPRSALEALPTDQYGENAYDRLKDHADNGVMPPQFRDDLHAVLEIANTRPASHTAGLLEAACAQLDKAADQFAFYADEHAKKGTKEGETKGAVNHQWALACTRVANEARAKGEKL